MKRYKCGDCGHIQDYDGSCESCERERVIAAENKIVSDHIGDMKLVNKYLNSKTNPNKRCCGCKKSQRVVLFTLLGIILIIGGLYFAKVDEGGDMGRNFLICGIFFLIFAACKPDFCLGNDDD